MIKNGKLYSEEDAIAMFNGAMRKDLDRECRDLGFESDLVNLNEALLAKFLYKGKECSVTLDAINAEVKIAAGDEADVDNFAGLTDNWFFRIGKEGIVDEQEYGYVFCECLNHLNYGPGPWILQAIALADGKEDLDFRPIPYDEIEILNPVPKEEGN